MMEYIDIVDRKGQPTGVSVPKSEIHSEGHLHNTAHLWLFNSNGQILLQQRSAKKLICPLLWDVSVAGHVDAGETPKDAAIREAHEEIGIIINSEKLLKIGVFTCFQSYANGIKDYELHNTYIAQIEKNITELKPDPMEVEALKFVSISNFKTLLQNSGPNNHFVPSNKSYYLKVLDAISKALNL